jgi:AmmeMemoRadiSam system protein B
VGNAQAILVPHAGYVYSGHTAGAVYAAVTIPRELIILGPNHTGVGSPISVMVEGEWETPLGMVRISVPLADALIRTGIDVAPDPTAHHQEHAIEVQLPFLQMLREDFRFLPIAVKMQQKETLLDLGEALAQIITASGEEVLLVLSSDMSHYEADAVVREKDRQAIHALEAVDAEGLCKVVEEQDLTMCGVAPAVATLTACATLYIQKAILLDYTTSAEHSGNYDRVVGYAGMAFM